MRSAPGTADRSERELPNARDHFLAPLIRLGGLGRRAGLDLDAVPVADAADLGVHEAGDPVFARQDTQVRTHGTTRTNDPGKALEDRRRQGSAAVVDDCNRAGRHATRHIVDDLLARAHVPRDTEHVVLAAHYVVAYATLLAPRVVGRTDHRVRVLEAEGAEAGADRLRLLVEVWTLAH